MTHFFKRPYFIAALVFAMLFVGTLVVFVARQSFAWTNPISNPPFATPSISSVGGNVGIGTASPSARLDLGTSGFAQTYASAGAGWGGSSNTAGFRTAWSSGYGASFEAWDGNAPKWGIYKWNANTPAVVMQGQYDTTNVNFAGNIGIGTTSLDSNYKLTTTGGGVKAETNTGQPAGYFNNTGGGPAISVGTGGITLGGVNQTSWPSGTDATKVLKAGDTMTGALSVNVAGSNFGTNTTCCASSQSPTLGLSEATNSNGRLAWLQFHNGGYQEAFLRLKQSERVLQIGDNQGVGASFAVMNPAATAEVVRLDPSGNGYFAGNVGIGTASPSYKLNVNGNANVATDLMVGATIGYGNSGTRTETRNDAGAMGGRSGFYETASPVNFPAGAAGWWHLLDVRHSNTGNNFAMQFAGSFFDQNLYFRKTNNDGTQPWVRVLTTADSLGG